MSQTAVPPRARRAYELARVRRAFLHAVPALAFLVVLVLEGASSWRVVMGVTLYATAVLALWLGQSAGSAVWPALAFGAVPFTLVRVAELTDHVCTGGACVSWCLPACLLGGAIGGLLVGLRSRRASDRIAFMLTAATLVFLSGALGCDCAGSAGMCGVAIGVLVGSTVPLVLARRV